MLLIKKLNFIFSRNQKLKFLALLILTFVGAIAETLSVTMIMPFISVATNTEYIFQQPILTYIYEYLNMSNPNYFLMLLAIVLIVVYISKTVYLFIMYKLQYRFVYNNQMAISIKLMDCYLKKSYEYHANKNSSEMIQGVTQDVTRLFNLVLGVVLFITEIMVVICVAIILIFINTVLVVSTVIMLTCIMFLIMKVYRKSLKIAGVDNQKSYEGMIKWISQGIGGIKEIKVVRREQFFIDEYSKAARKYAKSQQRYSFLSQTPRLFIETSCICTILVVLSVLLYRGMDMSSMMPQLAAFALAAFRIMPSFNRMTNYYNSIIFNKPSIDLVYRELRESEKNLKSPLSINNEILFPEGAAIKVKNLSYRYPNTNNYVLENATFEISIKKSTAIIGTSGAGKTTFADIFLGLLNPESGEISISGMNVHENATEWSKKLGYIPQTIYLCDDTIRRNVAFGIEESQIDEEKVNAALEKAQLDEFIKSLPNGVETEIGERGIRLSGGQRQRIGIARVFYNDPEIFVLDEATSALDNDTESAVMEAINAVKGKKTMIIIAHRLSTIKNCDFIYKIENGNVIES